MYIITYFTKFASGKSSPPHGVYKINNFICINTCKIHFLVNYIYYPALLFEYTRYLYMYRFVYVSFDNGIFEIMYYNYLYFSSLNSVYKLYI